jgi:hypothetical protein
MKTIVVATDDSAASMGISFRHDEQKPEMGSFINWRE